jgi:hypothetical protein
MDFSAAAMGSRPQFGGEATTSCSQVYDRVGRSTPSTYRYQNHRSSYMALRSTARRFGFEVSWLIRLTRQETSPFGPCLTSWLHWQLVIRHSSGHAIALSCLTARLSGKVMTLVACVFIWGSTRLSCIPNPTISVFFYNNGEGPLQAFLKPSLSITHIMASGDTCPQGTFNAAVVATLRRRYPERFPP